MKNKNQRELQRHWAEQQKKADKLVPKQKTVAAPKKSEGNSL